MPTHAQKAIACSLEVKISYDYLVLDPTDPILLYDTWPLYHVSLYVHRSSHVPFHVPIHVGIAGAILVQV